MQYEKTDGPTNGGTDGQMYRGTDVRTVFYSNYIYRLKVREALKAHCANWHFRNEGEENCSKYAPNKTF